MINILLNEKDFEDLVSGKIIKKDGEVKVALQDIGYCLMLEILQKKIDNFIENK